MDFIVTSIRRTRIRVRSWHDVVLVAALVGLFILLDFLLKKFFPNMKPKAAEIISGIVIVIVGVIGYILITPLTQ
ncbi:MAG: hypothetical protein ACI4JD_03630 [Ruminococcus sp.]